MTTNACLHYLFVGDMGADRMVEFLFEGRDRFLDKVHFPARYIIGCLFDQWDSTWSPIRFGFYGCRVGSRMAIAEAVDGHPDHLPEVQRLFSLPNADAFRTAFPNLARFARFREEPVGSTDNDSTRVRLGGGGNDRTKG